VSGAVAAAAACARAECCVRSYSRDWRYHKEEKCWLTRASGQGVVERTQTHERGTYYVFDATHWRKVRWRFSQQTGKHESREVY